jgi:hypothetical protein
MNQNKIPQNPSLLGVPSGVSKTISEPTVRFAQTMHLSCTDTSTLSKQTKWDSTWLMSPKSSIGCVQNDFWAYGMFGTNPALILPQN